MAHEAGGAEAVAPVAAMLRSRKICLPTVVVHPWSESAFRRWGVPVSQIVTWTVQENAEAATSLLKQEKPALVITGAGGGDSLDSLFIYAARRQGVPTLALLDFWSNYSTRFSDQPGRHINEQGNGGRPEYLPDLIAVMDEDARRGMVAAGFPEKCLVVTGHPRFDAIANWGDRDRTQVRNYWAEQYQINPDDLWVLFLSQPLRALYKLGGHQSSDLPDSEMSLLTQLLTCLATDDLMPGRKNVLLVRHHPKQEPVLLHDLQQSSRIPIRLAEAPGPQQVLAISDLVVGLNTVLLVDAFLMGRPVVSLQFGLKGADQFPFGGIDGIPRVFEASRLRTELCNALVSPPNQQRASAWESLLDGCATERVVALVKDLAGKS